MRARSGAIHSDSQESFTQLAQIAMNKNGIFYDERLNRDVMSKIASSKKKQQRVMLDKPQLGVGRKHEQKNLFAAFDFDIEFQENRQEREQLDRMKVISRKQINIGIIASDPHAVIEHLCNAFSLTVSKDYSLRGVDLIVGNIEEIIYKYWIFNKEVLEAQQEDNSLLGLYLSHCSVILDTSGMISVVKCNIEGWDTCSIKENILTSLAC